MSKKKKNKEGCEGSTGKCGWATISQVIAEGDDSWLTVRNYLKPNQVKMLDELRILECGGKGNCGYYVIASGLNMNVIDGQKPGNWKQSDVRDWLASMLTPEYLTPSVLDNLKRHYMATVNEDEFDRVARDYKDWLEDKKNAGIKKFPKLETVPDDQSIPDDDLTTYKFKYGEASFVEWQAEGIFDETIFSAYLTYVCDHDKKELAATLQKHAKHYSWQLDAFTMQVLSEYNVLKSRKITLVSVSTEHTNPKHPLFVSVFPSFDLVPPTEDRRYLLCYNEGRSHWQLLGKQVSAGKYMSLFSYADLPKLIQSYMNTDVDEAAQAYFIVHGSAGVNDGSNGSSSDEKKQQGLKRSRSKEKEDEKEKEKKRRQGTGDMDMDADMSKDVKEDKRQSGASSGSVTMHGIEVPLPRLCDVQGKSQFDIRLDHGGKKSCHDGAQLKLFLAAVRADVLINYHKKARYRPHIMEEIKELHWHPQDSSHVNGNLLSVVNDPHSVARIDSFVLFGEEAHLQTRQLVQRLVNLLQAPRFETEGFMFLCSWLHFELIAIQNSTAPHGKGRKHLHFVIDDEAASELISAASYYSERRHLTSQQKSVVMDWVEFGLHMSSVPPLQFMKA